MTSYVALIRGIMPMNPNMRNEKLRGVFEGLGFEQVKTVISSGNVIFASSSKSASALETQIEKALADKLGFKTTVMVHSKTELETLVKKDPFKGKDHSRTSYLIVTFSKTAPREVFNTLDVTRDNTTGFMSKLEKKYGKEITTRTWKTVRRIVEKM
jgi:uncharacterized protein (DUF1697 family)